MSNTKSLHPWSICLSIAHKQDISYQRCKGPKVAQSSEGCEERMETYTESGLVREKGYGIKWGDKQSGSRSATTQVCVCDRFMESQP